VGKKPRLFDRPECKNCVLREAATAEINAHTTYGENIRLTELFRIILRILT